jgi:hypothetical protein
MPFNAPCLILAPSPLTSHQSLAVKASMYRQSLYTMRTILLLPPKPISHSPLRHPSRSTQVHQEYTRDLGSCQWSLFLLASLAFQRDSPFPFLFGQLHSLLLLIIQLSIQLFNAITSLLGQSILLLHNCIQMDLILIKTVVIC